MKSKRTSSPNEKSLAKLRRVMRYLDRMDSAAKLLKYGGAKDINFNRPLHYSDLTELRSYYIGGWMIVSEHYRALSRQVFEERMAAA